MKSLMLKTLTAVLYLVFMRLFFWWAHPPIRLGWGSGHRFVPRSTELAVIGCCCRSFVYGFVRVPPLGGKQTRTETHALSVEQHDDDEPRANRQE